jgi:hypothetical protein
MSREIYYRAWDFYSRESLQMSLLSRRRTLIDIVLEQNRSNKGSFGFLLARQITSMCCYKKCNRSSVSSSATWSNSVSIKGYKTLLSMSILRDWKHIMRECYAAADGPIRRDGESKLQQVPTGNTTTLEAISNEGRGSLRWLIPHARYTQIFSVIITHRIFVLCNE